MSRSSASLRASSRPVGSLRSPVPLLLGGIAVAVLLIVVAGLPLRPPPPDLSQRETLNEREAVTLVAQAMRTGDAALRVAADGRARFEDGSWFVAVGEAVFRFSERNRIVLADNDAARQLQFRDR